MLFPQEKKQQNPFNLKEKKIRRTSFKIHNRGFCLVSVQLGGRNLSHLPEAAKLCLAKRQGLRWRWVYFLSFPNSWCLFFQSKKDLWSEQVFCLPLTSSQLACAYAAQSINIHVLHLQTWAGPTNMSSFLPPILSHRHLVKAYGKRAGKWMYSLLCLGFSGILNGSTARMYLNWLAKFQLFPSYLVLWLLLFPFIFCQSWNSLHILSFFNMSCQPLESICLVSLWL